MKVHPLCGSEPPGESSYLEERARLLETLHRSVREMALERTKEGLARRTLEVLSSKLGIFHAAVRAPDPESPGRLAVVAGPPGDGEGCPCGEEAPSAFASGRRQETKEEGRLISLSLPLVFGGQSLGVLSALDGEGLTPLRTDLLGIAAEHMATVWGLNNLLDAGREEALTDPLTGLWNRRRILGRLEEELFRALPPGRPGSMVLVDIGDFKKVNDRLGHSAGDEVLRAVASAMRSNLRKSDLISRFGGDEFLLFLPGAGEEEAAAVMKRMGERFAGGIHPLLPGSLVLDFGLAAFPEEGRSLEDSLALVDGRMYEYKRRRKAAEEG